ncbi:hypothetical protein P280DRAFT_469007 [Massarina eburnea CBS 473.64]|uniref:Uncharacterized protein n=1 Tax=Massarina eburnea CBS 473.64 TaxID=1395130 RepID=A0A6A6S206_9PLEO|nr:hypothetical protein P280DRAFT_469007 [Massarina eburnea CBS 473.64]
MIPARHSPASEGWGSPEYGALDAVASERCVDANIQPLHANISTTWPHPITSVHVPTANAQGQTPSQNRSTESHNVRESLFDRGFSGHSGPPPLEAHPASPKVYLSPPNPTRWELERVVCCFKIACAAVPRAAWDLSPPNPFLFLLLVTPEKTRTTPGAAIGL